jgi:hypothetical protein
MCMKRKVLAFVFITVIAISVATWLVQKQTKPVEPITVEIETFSLTGVWENIVGLSMTVPFNMTVHNTGINNISGLKLSAAIFVNETSKVEAKVLSTNEEVINPDNFTLLAGEIREVEGWIGTTLYALEVAGARNVSIGGTNSGWNFVATIKLGSEVLDEFRLP